MRYVLGIHLGQTRTTAAVCRLGASPWGKPEVVPLLGGAPWLDSVVYVSADGELQVGHHALRHAAAEPHRIARWPLHRTGDPVPYVLGDLSYPPQSLAAGLIGWIADRVAEAEGAHAERIVVTHPPSWSGYRRRLLHDALDEAQLPGVLALPSPIAAAEAYLARDEVPVGSSLAVCHIGGERVETAVLRRQPRSFELVLHAESAEHSAGTHLDDLLVEYVLRGSGVDASDPAAMAKLRAACTAAKERLSQLPEVLVTDRVSVSRAQFEKLAQPALTSAIAWLERAVSDVPEGELHAAVLVGGTARIPLARQLAEATLSCPVAVDDDPATALCRGAALAAQPRMPPPPKPAELSEASMAGALVTHVAELPMVYGPGDEEDPEPPPERPPIEISPLEPPKRKFSLARKGSGSGSGSKSSKTESSKTNRAGADQDNGDEDR